MADPKTLAEKTIVERKGDDALDRRVNHVIDHPEPTQVEPEAEQVEDLDDVDDHEPDEDQDEDFLGF
jgi:hypothetical protein